jgi:hypothetical protein
MMSKPVLQILIWLLYLPTAFGQPATLRQGEYLCEDGDLRPTVLRVIRHPVKPDKLILNWAGRDRILHAVPTQTGALRYEGAISRLVYLQIPSKSLLLDNHSMQPVLNECAWQGAAGTNTKRLITLNGGSQ